MIRTVVSGRWSVVGGAGRTRGRARRRGITLTEILISIMILGVGLVSLATLFPIGLLRLRDAARWSRSATLLETAASDAISRGLFGSQSFEYADQLNYIWNLTPWYTTSSGQNYNNVVLTQDTPYYQGDWYTSQNGSTAYLGAKADKFGGPGLTFAYDPLWRYQTFSVANNSQGYYLGDTFEARFGYGLTTVGTSNGSADYDGNGPPSAHGLPRLTNFNRPYAMSGGNLVPIMPSAYYVPNIFVSQEDVVWQEANANGTAYTVGGVGGTNGVSGGGTPVTSPSPVIPDLNTSGGSVTLDWRYTWMFTGQLTNAANNSTFDGNIVIFENRPFGISSPGNLPYTPSGNFASQAYQVDGEIVVEGIFGYSGNIININGTQGGPGYGTGADRTVLLRWSTSMPDPVVRAGDWIADVTYERQEATVINRFYGGGNTGLMNWANKGEWDNLPAWRCFWYQVQKATPASTDPTLGSGFRSMVVYVNQNLQAKTVLNSPGMPAYMNAALIAPNVVNVIPQTIFVR